MTDKYVRVTFQPGAAKSYSYKLADPTWDPKPGDEGKVDDAKGEGWKRVYVVDVTTDVPPFQCKPISKAPPREDAADDKVAF